MTERVYLALGSNLGDREANLDGAVRMLDTAFGTAHSALSSFYSNPASGFEGPDFLNAAVCYELDMESLAAEGDETCTSMIDRAGLKILSICKEVERAMGRTGEGIVCDPSGKRIYHSRIIDIDVLLIGGHSISTPVLTVPHPRMDSRPFVLVPLGEILKSR